MNSNLRQRKFQQKKMFRRKEARVLNCVPGVQIGQRVLKNVSTSYSNLEGFLGMEEKYFLGMEENTAPWCASKVMY